MFGRFVFGLAVLMAPADPEGGGGGGGGGGGDGGGDDGKAAPQYVTVEQLNKALGARDKRFEQTFTAKVTETLGTFGKTLEEKLAAFAPKPPDGDGGDPKGSGKQVDPELVKLRQEQEALRKKLEASEKKALEAETKSRNERALSALRAELSKHVRPEAVDTLVKAFRGDITFDSDGNPQLPFEDGATTIDAAIGAWAKSDGAKLFIPAPNGGGAGTQRTSGGGRINSDYKNKPMKDWTPADRHAAYLDGLRSHAENEPNA